MLRKAWWFSLFLLYKGEHWSTRHLHNLLKIPQLVSDGLGALALIHLTPPSRDLAAQLRCRPTQRLYLRVGDVSRKTRKRIRVRVLKTELRGRHSTLLPFPLRFLLPNADLFFRLMPHHWFFFLSPFGHLWLSQTNFPYLYYGSYRINS